MNDSPRPSVNVPLGDFFCNGLARRQFVSLPLAVTKDAFVCRFPMPFGRSAKAELKNESNLPVSIEIGYVLSSPTDLHGINYFHSTWRRTVGSGFPHCVLAASGKGHLVGCYLSNTGMDGTWNIMEGDDQVFLDGEVVPSLSGTGMEDYFNGAWYYNGLFNRPLHGLVEKAAMNTCQYRFHLPDRIGFEKGIFFTFEFGAGNTSRGYMTSVAYWYQSEPHEAPVLPSADARLLPSSPMDAATVICRLIELERVGRFDEAMETCNEYEERLAGTPWADMLDLRSIAYREELMGFDAVRNSYVDLLSRTEHGGVRSEAEKLLWFHESETNALLGVTSFGRYRVFLDQKFIGEGDSPTVLAVYPVALTPGEHCLNIEMTPTRPHAFLMSYLRCHGTNIITDSSWEYSEERPAIWPATSSQSGNWKPVVNAGNSLPKMVFWEQAPNAQIKMQAVRTGIFPWDGWHSDGKTAFVRKIFSFSPPSSDRDQNGASLSDD